MNISIFLWYYILLPVQVECFFPFFHDLMKRSATNNSNTPCNEDQLMMYLAEIQIINPESIIHAVTAVAVETVCEKVTKQLNKAHAYLCICQPPNQTDLYIKLIHGLEQLQKQLCAEGKYKTEFLKHHPCYHKLRTDYEDCNGPPDWTEYTAAKKICEAYNDIADCYYQKTEKLCGKKAAGVMAQLLRDVTTSVVTVPCKLKMADTGNANIVEIIAYSLLFLNLITLMIV